jgi:hypothetical protein
MLGIFLGGSVERLVAGESVARKWPWYVELMRRQLRFWELGHVSDDELLARLELAVRETSALTAEVVAHLAEVEERRLHLHKAFSSLFSYCVSGLGFSEDEACRRIEVARLARRFPELFPLLATGEVSLSVVALLKPHLTPENALELLQGVRSKSVVRAREFLAARFPVADVASSVRKLPPARRAATLLPVQPAEPRAAGDQTPANVLERASDPASTAPSTAPPFQQHPRTAAAVQQTLPPDPATTPAAQQTAPPNPATVVPVPNHSRATLTPLSADRYAVRFTATAELKRKLEQALDLLRHANPGGDLAPVVERALDLLLEDLLRKRFGKTRGKREKKYQEEPLPERDATNSDSKPTSRHVSSAVRRSVFERDQGRCTWTDPSGRRCDSQAWLQLDHEQPVGTGGDSGIDNVRLLCHAHNQLAAELVYGRRHVDHAIAHGRRQRRPRRSDSAAAHSETKAGR